LGHGTSADAANQPTTEKLLTDQSRDELNGIYHPSQTKGEPMPNYRVLVNENARYMDESERSDHGVFASAEDALAACKAMIDDELNTMHSPGMSAEELYRLYIGFGPDPFVVPLDPDDASIEFSAWSYAKQRCKEVVRRH
jgi:hypothetical protein